MNPLLSRRAVLGALGAVAALAPPLAAGQTFPAERVPVLPDALWRWVAAQLVLEPGLTWLDTATFGPTLRAVLARQYRQLESQSLDPHAYAASFGNDGPAVRAALESAGRFFVTDPGELELTRGARAGLADIAAGLDLQRGDQVLVGPLEHPAVVHPWLLQATRRGIDVVQMPAADMPASRESIVRGFEAAFGPRTRVLVISHVREADGAVLPVAEICARARSRGIFTVVDGAAAAGHVDVPITSLGCDVYVTVLDRWLNGPVDAGLLYVRRDSLPRVRPLESADASDVSRLGPLVAAMPLAFEFQDAVVRPRLQLRIRQLASQFRAGVASIDGVEVLTPADSSLNAGIVTFRVAGRDPDALAESIAQEDRIVIGTVHRGSAYAAMRASLHPANDDIAVERCLAAIRRRI